jgi:predicted RNA-binding Zn ribbon-like protein
LELPLWILARSAADLLTSEQHAYVRQCASEECTWLFIDRSKNHSRRWCDMGDCGNREKARRLRARKRAEA